MSTESLPIRTRLQQAPERTYQPCPAWCATHQTTPSGGRTHSGRLTAFFAEAADSGKRVNVGVWVERRDDGFGTSEDFGILDMKCLEEVELTVATMYRLSKALEDLVYSTAAGKPAHGRGTELEPVRPTRDSVRDGDPGPGRFARRMTELLKADGRSFRVLAAAVHADAGHLNKIASGARPIPGPALVAALDLTLGADGELVRIAGIERPPIAKVQGRGGRA